MLKQTSTPHPEMPVELLATSGGPGQHLRGFVCVSARNPWHLLPAVIAGLIWGFLWMPSRPHQQQPSGLGWIGSEKFEPAACILDFASPVVRARTDPTWQALLVTGVSWQALDSLWTPHSRYDMGEDGHVANTWRLHVWTMITVTSWFLTPQNICLTDSSEGGPSMGLA